jgi:acyl-phosphate glycerol 3-phosphate acyltransferase
MTGALFLAVIAVAAYLVGAVPFGYLVARARGVDILSHGSGNIGATNVGRILGRGFGILVFLLDFAKGALPTLAAGLLAPADVAPEWSQVTAGIAAFLGHLFPIYLRFRGGKGVATGAGVVAVLAPLPTTVALLIWAAVFSGTRYMSLASLTAAAVLCALRIAFTPGPFTGPTGVVTVFCLVAASLVALRHRANIGRLLSGTENRFKESSTMSRLGKTLHVLAVGLWFGSVAWFTVTGIVVFGTFSEIAKNGWSVGTIADRPVWLPVPPQWQYDPTHPGALIPDKLRVELAREQGTRVAGAVVGPLFPIYYAIQAVCAAVAAITASGWVQSRQPGTAPKLRFAVLVAALACVIAGWALEGKVSSLRRPRDEQTDKLLEASDPSKALIADAEAARGTFVAWHLVSLALNMLTLALVTVGMALTARLPAELSAAEPPADAGARVPRDGEPSPVPSP